MCDDYGTAVSRVPDQPVYRCDRAISYAKATSSPATRAWAHLPCRLLLDGAQRRSLPPGENTQTQRLIGGEVAFRRGFGNKDLAGIGNGPGAGIPASPCAFVEGSV